MLALQFGPWAPDVSDTPLQLPDGPGPTMVPLADCLNIFFANGSYQSVSSPAAATIDGNAVQALADTPVSAFSYFDTTESQETVFVGTPSGVWQLNPDGTWSAVAIVVDQVAQLVGAALTAVANNFKNNTTAPQLSANTATGRLTPAQTSSVIVAGTYQASTGPGTPSVVYYGYSGIAPNTFGTLPVNSISFGVIGQLFDVLAASSAEALLVVKASSNPGQSAFTSIRSNGVILNSSAATYSYNNGLATWTWPNRFGFAVGTTYSVVIT